MNRAGNERLSNQNIVLPVSAGKVIKEAVMVALNADGYAIEAGKSADIKVAGCSMGYIDNSKGDNASMTVPVRRGAFVWNNDGTIHVTDCLKKCYVNNNNTVSLLQDGSSLAGIILEVSDDGVVVDMFNYGG